MKKIISLIIVFAFFANVLAQLNVDSTGQVGIGTENPQYPLDVIGNARVAGDIYMGGTSNVLGTTNGLPIMFKVNGVLAGSTGYDSLYSNVSFGYGALSSNTAGFYNTANGDYALSSNTEGYINTANGFKALYANTSGLFNTASGGYALFSNTTGSNNTATGTGTLYLNTTGNENTVHGAWALASNTTGSYNTAHGSAALSSNTTGSYNTAHGSAALSSNTTGSYNTANGRSSLSSNTVGSYNTANGYLPLYHNTTGKYNIAHGYSSLYNNTTGNYNIANGGMSLYHNTTGNNNTANGSLSLYYNTTGYGNTANGRSSLSSNTTGSYNTAIGHQADVNANNLSNATAIGYNVKVTSSDQVRIGNSSVTSIGGYAEWTNFSDGRAKKNIRADVPGLAFINQLQPVTYNLDFDVIDGLLKIDQTKEIDGDEFDEPLPQELKNINKKAREIKEKQVQTGFVAQDVEQIAKSIGYDFSGVDVDETGIYGLRYAEFVVPLVKAVQELSTQNDQLQTQVNELTKLVYSLQGKDAGLTLLRSGSADESATGLQELTGSGVSLEQNIPNPFNQTTVIRYTLPQICNSAQIVITNPAGSVVRQIPLSVSGGTDSITIEGGALSAGIYYYSLYVDKKLIDAKQMILTK
jgi:hypothetical protein